MNQLDYFILFAVGIGTAIGVYQGFLREAAGIVGILLALLVANLVAPLVRPHLDTQMASEQLSAIVVWVITFLLAMFLLRKLAFLLARMLDSMQLGWINRAAGGFFGALKYCLILSLAISVVEVACAHIDGPQLQSFLADSVLLPRLHGLLDVVAPWAYQHILQPALSLLK